ncbi:MAG: sodium/solute symporter [Deltaproteobacteria bacterium]|jgi:SSS family solute:Na+ symporter|nr:sodium/solute symporter [Deltaproteobacteria bacterium]
MALNTLDWTIIIIYLIGMIGLSFLLARGQKTGRDYYLGGNRTAPLPIALSTMATQCSTNSLLGAPAFVAFAAGGGMIWLQYELAVPFAMILLMALIFPVLRSLRLISLYAYLEKRFDATTRTIISILFQFMRAFGTGVTVYGISLVLVVCLNVPFWAAVMMLGVVTIVYDVMGGMKAVIWSDVIQIVVLFGAILAAIVMAVHLVGGLSIVFDQPARLRAVDFSSHGLGDGQTFGFWPMLIGGLFLYLAYYGCDQTQAQRELSTRSIDDTNRALFLDGMMRFPLVLSYCFLGLCLGAYALLHPDFVAGLPVNEISEPNYNLAVPVFVLTYFPHGLIGLVMVGLFAAAMSSLDSTLNALSALGMQDIVKPYLIKEMSDRVELVISKLLTVFWGVVCICFAFFVGGISDTIIESINKIGSLVNGPLLAVFLMGMLTRRVNGQGAIGGLIAGFGLNLLLWKYAPKISWLWWNVIGFFVAYGAGYLISLLFPKPDPARFIGTLYRRNRGIPGMRSTNWRPYYVVLALYGTGILALLAAITYII